MFGDENFLSIQRKKIGYFEIERLRQNENKQKKNNVKNNKNEFK